MDRRALFGSVVDQQMIELRPRHLPRNSALVMHRFEEIERARLLTRSVRKLHAVFAHERTVPELLEKAHATEGPVGISHQRFADVMAWENLFLKQDYLTAFARQHTGHRTSGRPTTHH